MRVFWFHDESLEDHPVAPLAMESLRHAGVKVRMASADRPKRVEDRWYFPMEAPAIAGHLRRVRERYKPISVRLPWSISIIQALRKLDKTMCRAVAFHRPARVMASFYLSAESPECVIVSRGRLLLSLMPWYLSRKVLGKSVRVVYYPFELFGQQGHHEAATARWFERWFLRHVVDVVITQNSYRLSYYQRIGPPRRVIVVRNYNKAKSAVLTQSPKPAGDHSKMQYVYAGLLTKKRAIDDLVKAVALLTDPSHLTLIGPQKEDFSIAEISEAAALMGEGRLSVMEAVDRSKLLEKLVHYEVGILNYDSSCLNNIYCAPAKLTDYLHCGLSVVAPDYPALREAIWDTPWVHWFHPGSPSSLAIALREAIQNRRVSDVSLFASLSQKYCWENEEAKVISAVIGQERIDWTASRHESGSQHDR